VEGRHALHLRQRLLAHPHARAEPPLDQPVDPRIDDKPGPAVPQSQHPLHGLKHQRMVIHAAERERRLVRPQSGDDARVLPPCRREARGQPVLLHHADDNHTPDTAGAQDAVEPRTVELRVVQPERVDAIALLRRAPLHALDVRRQRRVHTEGVLVAVRVEQRQGVAKLPGLTLAQLRHQVRDHRVERIPEPLRRRLHAFPRRRRNLRVVAQRERDGVLRHTEFAGDGGHGDAGHGP
jgi:hypothetical protein